MYLLQYNGTQFVPAFNLPMDSRPYGLTFVRTKNAFFLAVAFYDLPQSLIMKWNGVTFENHQSVASSKVSRENSLLKSMVLLLSGETCWLSGSFFLKNTRNSLIDLSSQMKIIAAQK